ncbi:MAG: NADH-quinone oxidoreductase subunit J [Anaerolineae bacterium]
MIELVVFFILAGLAVGSALAMITARNLVHAVLWMVGNFAAVAVLFLMLQAPFLAAVQLIVYAGAIMVLFLFVVMLMGPRPVTLRERLAGQRWLAIPLVLVLLAALVSVVATDTLTGQSGSLSTEQLGSNNPLLLGERLYTKYIFPFEIVSVLLLVAMVGAVVLAKREAFLLRRR